MTVAPGKLHETCLIGNSHVKYGRHWHPLLSIDDVISKSVRRIVWEGEHTIGQSGSSTLLRYRGRNWIIACRHSIGLKGADLDDSDVLDQVRICGVRDGILDNIGFVAARAINDPDNEELSDLVALEADLSASKMTHEACAFQDVPFVPPHFQFPCKLVGCPRKHDIDYESSPPSMIITTAIEDCFVDPQYLPSVHKLARFTFANKALDLDGMSGGAIFSVYKEGNYFGLGLTGIIVRGGQGNVYVVPSNLLKTLLAPG